MPPHLVNAIQWTRLRLKLYQKLERDPLLAPAYFSTARKRLANWVKLPPPCVSYASAHAHGRSDAAWAACARA